MPDITGSSDESLIMQFRSTRDPGIVGILFERYTHLVYGVCMKYLKDSDQCKDAVMEIFETLFSKLSDHQVINFKSWLYSVTRNYCLMEIRKTRAFGRLKEKLQDDFKNGDMEFEPVMHLMDEDDGITDQILMMGIESLVPGQAECVRMMYLEHLSYREISSKTGHSMNEVKSHIQNGKRNLKNYLLNYHDNRK